VAGTVSQQQEEQEQQTQHLDARSVQKDIGRMQSIIVVVVLVEDGVM
tara:strand:+ start:293 stop:433 length:141 start_codon:yes stop_codon:yes gene_type:complete